MDDSFAHAFVGMTETLSRTGIRNRLLQKMSEDDWTLIRPNLEAVTLKERQIVEVPQKPITHLLFVEVGVVSVVAVNGGDHASKWA